METDLLQKQGQWGPVARGWLQAEVRLQHRSLRRRRHQDMLTCSHPHDGQDLYPLPWHGDVSSRRA